AGFKPRPPLASTSEQLAQRARSLIESGAVCRRSQLDPVFAPPLRHEGADLRAHLDLLRPGTRALLGQLLGRVDPELAANELALGCVVEVVEGALADHDVAGRL